VNPTVLLPLALSAWGTPAFKATLKQELEQLDPRVFPLQEGLALSSYALYDKVTAVVSGVTDTPSLIQARVGLFYAGIIAGCSCADDPTPIEPQNEYCEVLIAIDKSTAVASVLLRSD
jgi:hypothetical protein